MEKTTKRKIREVAEKVFFEEINPNLNKPIFSSKEREVIINGIEKGITLAVNQGGKW